MQIEATMKIDDAEQAQLAKEEAEAERQRKIDQQKKEAEEIKFNEEKAKEDEDKPLEFITENRMYSNKDIMQ